MIAHAMSQLATELDQHRQALFGLCYRMLGSAADADDLVQDTFRRALERPPKDTTAPLRPWLVTVATRLCIDALRKRRREKYFGPWLPGPIETEKVVRDLEPGPDARYDLVESASLAFLIALEALDPRQRATLVLRDVMGLTGPETAEALDVSPENARVLLHRARKALEGYDQSRRPITPELAAKVGEALQRLTLALSRADPAAVVDLLSEDVLTVHDGGGDYIAAVRPVAGREQVLELYRNIAALGRLPERVAIRELNGLPALVAVYAESGRYAPRATVSLHLDAQGRIDRIWTTVNERKLTGVPFPGA